MFNNSEKRPLIIKIVCWFLVFLSPSFIFTPSVYSDSLNDAVIVEDYNQTSLEGLWKIKRADSPEFKNPDYDDSDWQTIEVPSNMQKKLPAQPGYIWYRKKIYLPATPPPYNLGLHLGKIASIDETFINGYMIGNSGSVTSNNIDSEKIRIYQIPNDILVFGGYNLVSVRVREVFNDTGGIYNGKVVIGDYSGLLKDLIRTEANALIFSGVFVILGCFSLFFYSRRIHEREYLFFGLGAIGLGAYTFYMSQWKYILNMDSSCDFRIFYTAIYLAVPSFVRLTYESLLSRSGQNTGDVVKTDKLFDYYSRGLIVYAILLVFVLLFIKDINIWVYIDTGINDYVILLSSFIGIMYLIYKLRTGNKDVIFFFFGSMVAFISGILETVGPYINLPRNISMWGLVVFILSMTIVLTNKFLRLHNEVEKYSVSLEKIVDTRTKQLRLMEEARRRLLANISHDLRTPVNSALGNIELLLERIVHSPEKQQVYLKEIRSKLLGLNRLIQDLFQLSRIESCEVTFNMVPIRAVRLVSAIYEKYTLDVENTGIEFRLNISIPPTTMVLADTDRIDQVFGNLIANAVRYTDRDGVIGICCELMTDGERVQDATIADKMVLIKITDTGTGIAPEDIPYVFERLYQANKSRDSSSENIGLGLAIAKGIIEKHGGRMWVEEQAVQGCVICFTLPVRKS